MTHVATVGTKIQSASATTVSLTLTAGVAVGHALIVGAAWESAAGVVPTITSIADSRGNAYTVEESANAGVTVAVAIIRARVTTALQAGDTITITVSASRSRWLLQADDFDDLKTAPLDVHAGNSTGASSASCTTGTTANTTQAGELLYALWAFGPGRTVTLPQGWSGGAKLETTAGATDRGMQAAWSYVDGTGPKSATLGLSSASVYAGAITTYKTTAAAVGRVGQLRMEAPLPGQAAVARVAQLCMQVPAPVGVGVARVAQLQLLAPTRPGQPPYSGIKSLVDGKFYDGTISSG